MSEKQTVKSFFASLQVHLSDNWLESCIHWCKTEVLPPNYSPEELQSEVYEQWLLLDLRDLEVPVLPPDLASKEHFTLAGNFCLQMMQVIDISKPKLWQLQKIRNSNALTRGTQQDSDAVGTGKRVLQMTLTDGVQEVEAFEYHIVPCLSINLSPGIKIRIMGPVVIRWGRLMLEQQNVKILGGEVEELRVPNAAENVLARSLGLPLNPNPGVIQEKLLTVEQEENQGEYVTNFKPPPKKNVIKPSVPPPQPQKSNNPIHLTEEDEMCQEIDLLEEIEAEVRGENHRRSTTPDLFGEYDNVNQRHTSTQVQRRVSLSLDDDDDVFSNLDVESHFSKIENEVTPPTVTPNVITISKLLEKKDNIHKGVFRIKAKFKAVEEKLTFRDDKYKLVIKVEDSTGELTVDVHSDIVSGFAECSPADIRNLKANKVLGSNDPATQKILQTIMKVRDKLLVIDNVLMIQVERDKVPMLTKIL